MRERYATSLLLLLAGFLFGCTFTHQASLRECGGAIRGIPRGAESSSPAFVIGSALQYCPGGKDQNWANLEHVLSQAEAGLVLDIGAYDGKDAIAYARAGHQVLSFEPVPSKHPGIKANFKESGYEHRIQLHKLALSNFTGTVPFFINKPIRKKDSWVKGEFGSEQDSMFVPWKGARTVDVPVDTLDNVIGERTVLHAKIDAQGHDALVLEGAKRLLAKGKISSFSFEVAPKLTKDPGSYVRIIHWLMHHNYQCFDCTSFRSIRAHQHTMRIEEYIVKLSEQVFKYRGADHGHQSEFVCIHFNEREQNI